MPAATPTNVRITPTSDTTATLNWDTVSGATAYNYEVTVVPPSSTGTQTSDPWASVTLNIEGVGDWVQISGTPVTLLGTGNVRSFGAPASMGGQTLVFGFGSARVTVNIAAAKNAIVGANGSLTPIKLTTT